MLDGGSAHSALPGASSRVIRPLVPSNGQCGDDDDGMMLPLRRMPSPSPLPMDPNEDDGNGGCDGDDAATNDERRCHRRHRGRRLRPGNDANDANDAAPPPGLSTAAARRDEAAEEAETAAVVLRMSGGRRGEPRRKRRDADPRSGGVFRRPHNIISSWDVSLVPYHTTYSKSNTFHSLAEFSNVQNEFAIIPQQKMICFDTYLIWTM